MSAALIRAGVPVPARPWPRHVMTPASWSALAASLVEHPLSLVALWADGQQVHALFDPPAIGSAPLVASTPVEAGRYRALSPAVPQAAPFERVIHDMFGYVAEGGTDGRPWLDHGRWPQRLPFSRQPVPAHVEAEAPEMLEPDTLAGGGIDTHGLGRGPVGDMPGGPAHLRLTLRGERIARAEWRMGYAHRGATLLMRGKSPRGAARFAARIAGDATVAHSVAFARAAEAALDAAASPRAVSLAEIMLAVERVAVGWSRLAALARHAGAHRLADASGLHREHVLRACGQVFSHRLMMDVVVPGGLASEPSEAALEVLHQALATVADAWSRQRLLPRLPGLDAAALTRRLTTLQAGLGDDLSFALRALRALPGGSALPGQADAAAGSGEGFGEAVGSRGRTLYWLRLEAAAITGVLALDAGWAGLHAAQQALVGCALDDLQPVVNLYGLSSAAMDT